VAIQLSSESDQSAMGLQFHLGPVSTASFGAQFSCKLCLWCAKYAIAWQNCFTISL